MSAPPSNAPTSSHNHDAGHYSDDNSSNGAERAGRSRGSDTRAYPKVSITGPDEWLPSDNSHDPFLDPDAPPAQPQVLEKEKESLASWASLPHKRQLAVLTMSRLSEPLVQTSILSYMFYLLKSFDESLPDAVIASQAGILQGSFTGAQFLTAMVWGRISDSDWGGRKTVVLIGLLGTMISCLGLGFSTTFWQAVVCRTLGGALNGNVGVMRTMISEIIQEKRYQSRAFLLLPMCFNVGVIIGPILGGLLADPAGSYPNVFGGILWLHKFPYALPNILNAFFLLLAATSVFFGLEETLESIRYKEDFGTKCGRKLVELFRRCRGRHATSNHKYEQVRGDEQSEGLLESASGGETDVEMSPVSSPKRSKAVPRFKQKLPFGRIFTRNVLCTLLAHSILACHAGTFNNLWFVFISTPVDDPNHPNPPGYRRRLPFIFNGGLGMPPRDVGFVMSVLGIIGINMQLFVYPIVNAKIGTVKSWRIFLYCFPLTYAVVPFLSIVPSKTPPPAEKDGVLLYLAIVGVLFLQVIGRTFAMPASIILINNCSPHPSVLGSIHGIAQSVSSGARTIGPVLGGFFYGLGLNHGIVGAVWWGLSAVAICGCIASNWVREGDGHEIKLEGDDEAEAEFQEDASRVGGTR